MKLPKWTMAAAAVLFTLVLLGIFLYRIHPGGPAFAEIPQAVMPKDTVGRIDLNTADLDQLTLLPGIGEELGQRIIEYRELLGGFTSIRQLAKIQGLSASRIEKIRDYITIGG